MLPAHDKNDEILKAMTYLENKLKHFEATYVQYADKSDTFPQLLIS